MWSWQLCSPKQKTVLQPDGVRLDPWIPGLHICLEKHTDYSSFSLFCKAPLQRGKWDIIILNGLRLCLQLRCLGKAVPVSFALHSVSQQILFLICHWEIILIITNSLWRLCVLQVYTVECHLKGREGRLLLAAFYQTTCTKQEKGEEGRSLLQR